MVAQIRNHDRGRIEMIHGDIEESLNLLCVKIHRENAVRTGDSQKVRNQFCGNRHARTVFSVLTGVTEERDHGSDSRSGRTPCRIKHDQELHDIFIGRIAGRLNEKDVSGSEIVYVLNKDFAVGKTLDVHMSQFHFQMSGN